MKIYICHSRELDYIKDLYLPLRESDLNMQHEIFLPHEDALKTVKSKDIIKSSDIVLAEASLPATGMGIELGWADAFEVPIVCFYKTGSKISGSLQFIAKDIIEYTDTDDLVKKISDVLTLAPESSI